MKIKQTYRDILINLAIAFAISLIVNFSIYILRLNPPTPPRPGGWWEITSTWWYMTIQTVYYMTLAFVMLSITTVRRFGYGSTAFTKKVILCIAVALLFYFFAPRFTRDREFLFMFQAERRLMDPTLMLKVSFTLIVSLLYGKIYELVYQKQNIVLENEKLKNENLQTTYNTLINQINPHFFFNSLNSLSMLVREKHNEQALVYIDRLSDTFRYIIQNGQTGDTTLEEELRFTDAYKYLLEVRYQGKLFFDISIPPGYTGRTIPSFTLQPLLENAVKHNKITKASPLRVTVSAEGDNLIVSNPINPKIDKGDGTGIGLKNLSERYRLLTGKDITVVDDGSVFSVILPLGKSKESESSYV